MELYPRLPNPFATLMLVPAGCGVGDGVGGPGGEGGDGEGLLAFT